MHCHAESGRTFSAAGGGGGGVCVTRVAIRTEPEGCLSLTKNSGVFWAIFFIYEKFGPCRFHFFHKTTLEP